MHSLTRERSERIKRWLLRVLRHTQPSDGLRLDSFGWANLDVVLDAIPVSVCGWTAVTRDELQSLIAAQMSDRVEQQEHRIRARYGHSNPSVDVCWPSDPPESLFHATTRPFLPSVFAVGLLPGHRTRVHLTSEILYARELAVHLTQGVILRVSTSVVLAAGIRFFATSTHVWQASTVPSIALSILETVGSDEDD